MAKKKITTRQLEESSWLAQIIKDKMEIESNTNGITALWHNLNTLYVIVREADNKQNDKVYYYNNGIIICTIPDLSTQNGTNYSTEGMQAKLRGLAESYKDDNGNYIVDVRTTHDLNTATIKNISDLLFEMSVEDLQL